MHRDRVHARGGAEIAHELIHPLHVPWRSCQRGRDEPGDSEPRRRLHDSRPQRCGVSGAQVGLLREIRLVDTEEDVRVGRQGVLGRVVQCALSSGENSQRRPRCRTSLLGIAGCVAHEYQFITAEFEFDAAFRIVCNARVTSAHWSMPTTSVMPRFRGIDDACLPSSASVTAIATASTVARPIQNMRRNGLQRIDSVVVLGAPLSAAAG